mmetsp:Transcript_17551/g.24107  ORF Transcript_17551/g.24107 Transcript_17551/m.24107 type:complete len:244 (+) Transcript_17551:1207-1938(+)
MTFICEMMVAAWLANLSSSSIEWSRSKQSAHEMMNIRLERVSRRSRAPSNATKQDLTGINPESASIFFSLISFSCSALSNSLMREAMLDESASSLINPRMIDNLRTSSMAAKSSSLLKSDLNFEMVAAAADPTCLLLVLFSEANGTAAAFLVATLTILAKPDSSMTDKPVLLPLRLPFNESPASFTTTNDDCSNGPTLLPYRSRGSSLTPGSVRFSLCSALCLASSASKLVLSSLDISKMDSL